MKDAPCESIVDVLSTRAVGQAASLAFELKGPSGETVESLSFRELYARANRVASFLKPRVQAGDHVAIALRHGLDYIVAIHGALLVRAAAMPLMPISGRSRAKLAGALRVGGPKVVIHDDQAHGEDWNDLAPGSTCVCYSQMMDHAGPDDSASAPSSLPISTDIALVQFTSGSTSAPKAVCITHAALMANQAMIRAQFGHDENVHIVGWLPLYHDMGLVGNVFQPTFVGAPCTLLNPLHVVQRPLRWLAAISEQHNKRVTSGGPNFIYDLCVDRVTEQELDNLDLSNWSVAFNGSEMIRRSTVQRFGEWTQRAGFRASSWLHCYGMAEATLFVSGCREGEFPDRTEHPTAQVSTKDRDSSLARVACGVPACEVNIILPETHELAPDGVLGEVWIASSSLALGYLTELGLDQSPFQRTIPSMRGAFYNTQDLGFKVDGALYLAGRHSNMLKVRGVAVHLADIEHEVEVCNGLRQGTVAAIHPAPEPGQGLVLIVESERDWTHERRSQIARSARQVSAHGHGAHVEDVMFVRRASLPKTSSGKLMRNKCRELYATAAAVEGTRLSNLA